MTSTSPDRTRRDSDTVTPPFGTNAKSQHRWIRHRWTLRPFRASSVVYRPSSIPPIAHAG